MDGQSWTQVHQCSDNYDLNGHNLIGIYSVNALMRCRFIRLRQTGKDHFGCDCLALSGMEIFGYLEET
jgi:hypothetical protein